jgi:hypothetical protein
MTKKAQMATQQSHSCEQVMTPVSGKNGLKVIHEWQSVEQYSTSIQYTVVASPYAFLFSE